MGGLCWKLRSGEEVIKSQSSRVNQKDVLILDLKSRRKKTQQSLQRIESRINELTTDAHKYVKTNKEKAVNLIKTIKMYKARKETVNDMVNMLEKTAFSIEQTQLESEACELLKQGEKTLNEIKVNVEEFEEIYDSIKENQMTNDYLVKNAIEEEDLINEFNKLGCEESIDKEFEMRINMEELKAPTEPLPIIEKKPEPKVVHKEEEDIREVNLVLA